MTTSKLITPQILPILSLPIAPLPTAAVSQVGLIMALHFQALRKLVSPLVLAMTQSLGVMAMTP